MNPIAALLHASAPSSDSAVAKAVLFVVAWLAVSTVFIWAFVLSVAWFGSTRDIGGEPSAEDRAAQASVLRYFIGYFALLALLISITIAGLIWGS